MLKWCFCNLSKIKINKMSLLSEWLLLNNKWVIFQLYQSWREQVTFDEMMMSKKCLLCSTRPTSLDFYCASSLKQQSVGRHVPPLEHIILILNQPVFALSPKCWMISREATNTNFIVFGVTHPGIKRMIYHTRGDQNMLKKY